MNALMLASAFVLCQEPQQATDPYDKIVDSVAIVVRSGDGISVGLGTGAIIDAKNGYLVTNHHVVEDQKTVTIAFPERDEFGNVRREASFYTKNWDRLKIVGQVVATDKKRDIAIVKLGRVPEKAKAIPYAKAEPPIGEPVYSVGNSGMNNQPGRQTVFDRRSGPIRNSVHKMPADSKGLADVQVITTGLFVEQGDSGGPVVNSKGQLIAIVSGYFEGQEADECIYFSEIQPVVDKIGKPGAVEPYTHPEGFRDPTVPSPKFDPLLRDPTGSNPAAQQARPTVPTFVLKGRVLGGRTPTAIIEVDGGLVTIQKGATFSVGGLSFRVVEISASEVEIEIKSLNQTLILN